MMKRSLVGVVLVMAGVAAVAEPASAQRIDSPYRFLDHGQYVGAIGGYVWAKEGRIGNGPQPAPYLAANWGLRVSGPFTVIADAGLLFSRRTVLDTALVTPETISFTPLGEVDMTLLTLLGGLRFNVTGSRTWHGLQPYIVMSAGGVIDLSGMQPLDKTLNSDLRFDFGTSFAGQFGVGTDWYPTSRVSVRVDARSLLWKVPIPEGFLLTEAGSELAGSEWETNFMLAAGLSIHF